MRLIDRLLASSTETFLVSGLHLVSHADRLLAFRTEEHCLARRHRARESNHLTLFPFVLGTEVFFDLVYPFHHDFSIISKNLNYLAGLSAIFTTQNFYFVVDFDLHSNIFIQISG